MLEGVAVSWSAAERYAASAEVIWLVGTRPGPGPSCRPAARPRWRLRLRVLRACRAVVSQQSVHL